MSFPMQRGKGAEMPAASIFLVEDEALIRMMFAEMVEELGHRVVAEAGDMVAGQALAETAIFDLAILDINIAGDIITPVAEIIDRRGLPFIFVSGYGPRGPTRSISWATSAAETLAEIEARRDD